MNSRLLSVLSALLAGGLLSAPTARAAWKNFDPTVDVYQDSANPLALPKKFSATGFYTDWAKKSVTPEAHYFEVNSALWSDGADKSRWLILTAGTQVLFNENKDYWDYPNGATFVKLFRHETVPGDTASRIWWETRVLINKEDASNRDIWYGLTYKWVPNGSEAYLLPPDYVVEDSSLNATFAIYPNGKAAPAKTKKWHFPRRSQCNDCHLNSEENDLHGRSVLGFFTAQLNRPSKANPSLNQIADFFQQNLFQWEGHGTSKPSQAQIDSFPRWYGVKDTAKAATVNVRARSYIGANCSGCHGTRGMPTLIRVNLNYDFWQMKPEMKFAYFHTGYETQLGPDYALLVPKRPDLSVILHRQKQRRTYERDVQAHAQEPLNPLPDFSADLNQMPPLATYEEDTAATQLITRWIMEFDTTGQIANGLAGGRVVDATPVPAFQGRLIRVPEAMAGSVSLRGVDGRALPLAPVSRGVYSLPPQAQAGVYILRVGPRSFRLSLL
ncbi:MAG: hypothetical protein ABIW76_01385 [Fibrobacteria bacterium]